MPINVPAGNVPNQLRKPGRLNSRRSTTRPAQSATPATKTFVGRSAPTVVASTLTSLLTVKNELQQFNPGIKIPGGKPTGWGKSFCCHSNGPARKAAQALNLHIMHKLSWTLLLTLPLIAACEVGALFLDADSSEIWKQMQATNYKSIDFSKLAGQDWTKVCFFGPYSDSTESELGFKWRVSEHTDLLMSDGHNVIVFATDLKVTSYVIHSRAYGDFAKLSGKCLPRASARVLREPSERNWKSYIAENASNI